MSKQNGKHIPGDWGVQEKHCAVCDHLLEKDTAAPVLEVLNDGESYTVEDVIVGRPGAYTFTVSDPAKSGEASSGVKSVTINGDVYKRQVSHREQIGKLYPQVLETLVYGACIELFE